MRVEWHGDDVAAVLCRVRTGPREKIWVWGFFDAKGEIEWVEATKQTLRLPGSLLRGEQQVLIPLSQEAHQARHVESGR